jgi:hypothetical protein
VAIKAVRAASSYSAPDVHLVPAESDTHQQISRRGCELQIMAHAEYLCPTWFSMLVLCCVLVPPLLSSNQFAGVIPKLAGCDHAAVASCSSSAGLRLTAIASLPGTPCCHAPLPPAMCVS